MVCDVIEIEEECDVRAGTSAIEGQLYETKLLSLFQFRLQNNVNIKHFFMNTNVSDMGNWDDVCIKLFRSGCDRPELLVFQAKHKIGASPLDFPKVLKDFRDSYKKIKDKIKSRQSGREIKLDIFHNVAMDDCYFVLCTNGKWFDPAAGVSVRHAPKNWEGSMSETLNELVNTNNTSGRQSDYDNENVILGILDEELKLLAESFVKYLNEGNSMNIMRSDSFILQYQVILAQKVVKLSDVEVDARSNEKFRRLRFRRDFFFTSDMMLKAFREKLYEAYESIEKKLKNKSNGKKNDSSISNINGDNDVDRYKDIAENLIESFLSKPSIVTLSHVIGTLVTSDQDKLQFNSKLPQRAECDLNKLGEINEGTKITPSVIAKACAMASTREKLSNLTLKVPATFGNIDMTIKKVKEPAKMLMKLCEKFMLIGKHKVVTVDDAVIDCKNILSSSIGNLLVHDEKTKYLMFTNNATTLGVNAKKILSDLEMLFNEKKEDLNSYRFDVQCEMLPKLVFDLSHTQKVMWEKLIVYECQGSHVDVENILKKEMVKKNRDLYQNNITDEAHYIYYHNEVQRWWMTSNRRPYLKKDNDFYQKTRTCMLQEPQICKLTAMFFINKVNRDVIYDFTKHAMQTFGSLEANVRTVILSEVITLTTLKVIQFLGGIISKYAVIELKLLLNLDDSDFDDLKKELKKTEKVIIIDCHKCDTVRMTKTVYSRLNEIEEAINDKRIVFICNGAYVEVIKDYFPKVNHVISDESLSLTDMTAKCREYFIENMIIETQGVKTSADSLIDEASMKFYKGSILNKIIDNESVVVGESLKDKKYNEILHYVSRMVTRCLTSGRTSSSSSSSSSTRCFNNRLNAKGSPKNVKTFYDIDENFVVITAPAGMGKSSLLTHLSLKTKEHDPSVWIARVNLADYVTENTKINGIMETLIFLCRVIFKDPELLLSLKRKKMNVNLREDGSTKDESLRFALNVFLNLFNRGKVIFLFDGLDSMFRYKETVLNIIDIIRNHSRGNRIWVATRPCSDILSDLGPIVPKYYKIEHIDEKEQQIFLKTFWAKKLLIDGNVQLDKVKSFLYYMSKDDNYQNKFRKIHHLFYDFLVNNFPHENSAVLMQDQSFHRNRVSESENVETLMIVPLYLQLIADYFVNTITIADNVTDDTVWEPSVNIIQIYDLIIKTKIKKILFDERFGACTNRSEVMCLNEEFSAIRIEEHKKLAANSLWGKLDGFNTFGDVKNMKPDINVILTDFKTKLQLNKSCGFISDVTANNIPVFTHDTFQEYFAAEYIVELLKNPEYSFESKRLLYFTVANYKHLTSWIKKRCKLDRELNVIRYEILYKDRPDEFVTWVSDCVSFYHLTNEQIIKLRSSSLEDYESNSFNESNYTNFAKYLKDKVNNENYSKLFKEVIIANMKPHLKQYFPLERDYETQIRVKEKKDSQSLLLKLFSIFFIFILSYFKTTFFVTKYVYKKDLKYKTSNKIYKRTNLVNRVHKKQKIKGNFGFKQY